MNVKFCLSSIRFLSHTRTHTDTRLIAPKWVAAKEAQKTRKKGDAVQIELKCLFGHFVLSINKCN